MHFKRGVFKKGNLPYEDKKVDFSIILDCLTRTIEEF